MSELADRAASKQQRGKAPWFKRPSIVADSTWRGDLLLREQARPKLVWPILTVSAVLLMRPLTSLPLLFFHLRFRRRRFFRGFNEVFAHLPVRLVTQKTGWGSASKLATSLNYWNTTYQMNLKLRKKEGGGRRKWGAPGALVAF